MAKKAPVEKPSSDDLLDQVRKELVGKHKFDGIISSGEALLDKAVTIISTGSPLLDDALNGGIPSGCFVGVSGKPKLGKTTLLLSAAKEAQKLERVVLYLDVEHRLKKMNLTSCKGLDLNPKKFIHIHSGKDEDTDEVKILSAQDFLDIAIIYLKTIPKLFVIIDSVSCLVSQTIMDGGLATQTRGGGAKLLSEFVDQIQAVVPIQDSNICSVSHIIADTSGKSMSGQIEKNANRMIYAADVRIKATYSSAWNGPGEKRIGDTIHWDVQCSALGGPGKADSWHRYGMGIDGVYESIEVGKSIGLIEGDGAWKQLVFLAKYPDLIQEGKIPNIQGMEKVYVAMNENQAWYEALKKEIKGFLNP